MTTSAHTATNVQMKKTKKIAIQKAENDFTLFIFGASGSLAKLKLFPAIYELVHEKRMPKNFKVVGYARTKMDNERFRKFFEKAVRKSNREKGELTDEQMRDMYNKNKLGNKKKYNIIIFNNIFFKNRNKNVVIKNHNIKYAALYNALKMKVITDPIKKKIDNI